MDLNTVTPRTISVPSKTFFMGEYVALTGGPSLVVCTEPRFLAKPGEGEHQFNPASPAGKYLKNDRNQKWLWNDPHGGKGGFGGSTAEYLSARFSSESIPDIKSVGMLAKEVEIYQNLMMTETLPSGADLVGQLCGRCTWWWPKRGVLKTSDWPFSDMGFFVLRMDSKVATHEHLAEVQNDSKFNENCDYLSSIAMSGYDSWIRNDSDDFVHNISAFGFALNEFGWQAEETVEFIDTAIAIPGVLAAKGCGAMGADVTLLIYNKEEERSIRKRIAMMRKTIVASDAEVSRGIEIK